MGITLNEQRNFIGAEAQFRLALSIYSDAAGAALYLGILLYRKGDYDEAEALYRSALKSSEEIQGGCGSLKIRSYLAELLITVRKDYAAAEAEYRAMLSSDPTNESALRNLSYVLREKGDHAAADAAAAQAVQSSSL